MATIIPAGVYGLRVPAGGIPILASTDPGVAFRITMAAIDPTADADPTDDGGHKVPRATLKLIRIEEDDDDDDEDDDDFDPEDIEGLRAKLRAQGVLGSDDDDDDDDMSLDDEDSEEEKNGGPSDPAKSKKAKRDALAKKAKEELDAEEMELDQLVNGKSKGKGKALNGDLGSESEEDSEDEEGDEAQELVICTLDPEKHWQQPLEITVREGEQIFFSANGTHDIFLSGNYVAIQDDSDDDEEDDDEYGLNGLDYDLSPDEDELDEDLSESEEDELDGLEDPRIMEVESDEEEAPKLVKVEKKNKNKRPAESEDEESAITLDELISKTKAETPTTNGEKLSKKQAKKLKNNDGQAVAAAQAPAKKDAAKTETPSNDKKKVQFSKNLEMGPTGSPKVEEAKKDTPKGPRTVSGVLIDDKKEGKGRPAKKGDRIEMRYIGKLKNGKQFDANKKGKPFAFKLGVGEVIKGWDIGVAGMTAGGERRLTIPAKLAYGNKSLPGIPANSDLIFDIKCISVN